MSHDLGFGLIAVRVTTAAAANGIDANALLAALKPFAGSLLRHARVTMTGEADRIAVRFPVPRDSAGQAALQELAGSTPVGEVDHVEVATTPNAGLEVWLHAEAPEGSFAISDGLVDDGWRARLRGWIALLDPAGPRGRSIRVGARDAMVHCTVGGERAIPSIVAVMEQLGLAARQRALWPKIHPLLAQGRDVVASLHVGEAGVLPELRVGYRHLPFETVVRVVAPVRPGHDVGRQLGHFVGALDGDDAAVFTLVLRPEDPLRTLLAVDLRR